MPSPIYQRTSYPITVLSVLTLVVLSGLLILAQREGRSSETVELSAHSKPVNLAELPEAELEQLAADILSKLTEKSRLIAPNAIGASVSINQPLNPRQIGLGMKNARRLLPLAKQLTLESLRDRVKASSLTKESKLIASVNQVLLDRTMGNSAEVRDDSLSTIWIGPEYAIDLVSDDEALLLLSHELTHIAARAGRLNKFIDSVTTLAQESAGVEVRHRQKEELACDFTAAEVLKRFIASNPTSEPSSMRFSLAFGYETRTERLSRAWADFCASYRGDARDNDHLSQDHTLRSLIALDEDLKAFVPDDAVASRICR